MEEYRTERIRRTGDDTEDMLNVLAIDGWELVCSYAAYGEWLIFRRKRKNVTTR